MGDCCVQTLARLNLVIASSLDVDTILAEILRSAVQLMEASLAAFFVANERRRTLELRAVSDEGMRADPPRNLAYGEGAVGAAAVSRQRIVVDDVGRDDRVAQREWLLARGVHSGLCVPVTIGETLVAVLAIGRPHPFVMNPVTEELLDLFAAQAAIAFQHARLYEEGDRRRRDAEVLGGLARAINASLDLDTVLQHVVEAARDLCQADAARIALRDPASGAMLFRYSTSGWRLALTGAPIQPGRELGGLVLLTGTSRRTEDWLNDPAIDGSSGFAEAVRAEGVKAAVVVPIRTDGAIEGLLYAVRRSGASFTDDDERRLLDLAGHAAIAIRNAQLYARTRSLSRRLVEAQEAERRLLARELHDQIGQDLTAVKLLLRRAGRAGGRARGAALTDALALVDELIERARGLSLDLRPAMLDDLGLMPALEEFMRQYRRRTGVVVELEHDGVPRRLSPHTETAAFRIVQEALTNVARHAETTTARVRLRWGEWLEVEIEDGGRGFDPGDADARVTAGLSGMRERARWLGGRFTIEATPGKGSRVYAGLPAHPTAR
jgi:signal transduction histidine kinase